MMGNLIGNLYEYTHKDLLRKQQDITQLFPTFHRRVQRVINKGGVRMVGMDAGNWYFKLHSGTEDHKWYKGIIQFKEVPQYIDKAVEDDTIWNKAKTGIDLNKLAHKMIDTVDVRLQCSCPAFLYWGSAYILTQQDAKLPPPENRPPNIRNPRQHGAMCKHLHTLFRAYPFYRGDMAKWLRQYYAKEMSAAIRRIKNKRTTVDTKKEDIKNKQVELAKPEVEDTKKDDKRDNRQTSYD